MKRKYNYQATGMPRKKAKHASNSLSVSTSAPPPGVDHPVLRRLYPRVLTLRHYLLLQIPNSSKGRRRRIAQIGCSTSALDAKSKHPIDEELGQLLDAALVCTVNGPSPESLGNVAKERNQDIETFTQQRSQGTSGGTFKPGYLLQSETVDFVIWCLFKRSTTHRPSHLLCHGFQRGARGNRLMVGLLLDCSIFLPVDGSLGNLYQLSGVPLSDLKPDKMPEPRPIQAVFPSEKLMHKSSTNSENRKPGAITFVRSRMLYARAALNAKGGVRFGMRHIHVLNRYSDLEDESQVVHIMRYIFPRQFGLHNAFTSKVEARETTTPFKDYTLREKDIEKNMCQKLGKKSKDPQEVEKWRLRIPKRLSGAARDLTKKMRILHKRCSYMEMLRHYCPIEDVPLSPKPEWRRLKKRLLNNVDATVESSNGDHDDDSNHRGKRTAIEQTCFTDMACHTAHVSAFCRAVIAKAIPKGFWGGDGNKRVVMYWIDQFIHLRRFESLTLHQVTQKLQITTLDWLSLSNGETAHKLATSDFEKRKEIFFEFIYWLFDSFLIPLIRTNFHVTESNVHRHRLFYFRHDVWRMLSEPALSTLKLHMFEEMPMESTTKLLSIRQLGFSKIRLLPKKMGFRTIMNLKRKQQVTRNGLTSFGRSINTVMAPVFHAITYEKSLQPDRFGGSLFSVGDMLPKLTAFKASLDDKHISGQPLYFAKVDVRSCFDTIPQRRLLRMIDSLMRLQTYTTGKHVEVSLLGDLQRLDGQHIDPMPLKRYVAHSGPADQIASFDQLVKDKLAGTKANTVFVNTNVQRQETKDDLMQLLREHVERNIVKIGKKYYRQKNGIPQGSVLSSILCNFFYAELERDVLGFTSEDNCLLLRLLDDFLLITTDRASAERFVHVMHRGHKEYGVEVQSDKSLTNFNICTAGGGRIASLPKDAKFPYCGVYIDTRTLEVNKKTERAAKTDVENSLTVDLSKLPGQTLHRKALNAFKIQLKAMLIDMALNSTQTVLTNVYRSFYEAAVRCLEYVSVLSRVRKTYSSLLIRTVDKMAALAFVMLQRRVRSRDSHPGLQKVISRRQLQWLACKAFQTVFERRQTQHGALLAWLKAELYAVRISNSTERSMLEDASACKGV
ncbi:hypothetical protein IAQ61_001790 [Plenodomus lingam]|uniref:uncharacterized protein n=1 Tax=Leptosphaeria maculans TaxID=5022 RepID=UPI00332CE23C|nr:hypothetical protein IAQ61_001790 [Plenodomus lingam]